MMKKIRKITITTNLKLDSSGFTIVELMIATVVFSSVLIVLTYGILQISNNYSKGVTETTTQNAARNVLDNVSQGIEFDGGNISTVPAAAVTPGTTYGFCIGTTRYYYQLGYEVETSPNSLAHQTYHGLVVVDNPTGGDSCSNGDCGYPSMPNCAVDLSSNSLPAGAEDLLQPNMRLTQLTVAPYTPVTSASNLYSLDLEIAYGGDDLLCNTTSAQNGCDASAPTNPPAASFVNGSGQVRCRLAAGQQYCDISELKTAIQQRLQ